MRTYVTTSGLAVAMLLSAAIALAQAADPEAQAGGQQGAALTESFDVEPTTGWEYSCTKELVAEGGGQALRVSAGGHALWMQPLTDLTLAFRLRLPQEEGAPGELLLRASGEPPEGAAYAVQFEPARIRILRRTYSEAGEMTEQELGSGSVSLASDTWHDVSVQAAGGQIDVSVAGTTVLSVTDAQPLAAGVIGFGMVGASGHVDYDDLVLTPSGPST